PLAPDALRPLRKEDLKGRMPYDARPNSRTPFPNHDEVTRILLTDAGLGGHLLKPHETQRFTQLLANKFVQVYNAHGQGVVGLAAAAAAGQSKREWYRMAAESLVGMFGLHASRFAALLAATSTKNDVKANLNH